MKFLFRCSECNVWIEMQMKNDFSGTFGLHNCKSVKRRFILSAVLEEERRDTDSEMP